jgi:hypothetical protein
MSLTEECRPLLEDWARESNVMIMRFYEWEKDGFRRCTAVGLDGDCMIKHNTVVLAGGE